MTGLTFGRPIKYSPKDNLMGDLNRDRFGVSLESKNVKNLPPGPGAYDVSYCDPRKVNNNKLGIIGHDQRICASGPNIKDRNPGPAYYQVIPMEQKTSFHYDRID
jgi:hypothetical protein